MTAAATIDVEERRTYIGASEAAAALGLSPWDDPVSLAMRKWGELPEKDQTFRMRLGQLIEPVIGDLYRQETGRKLRAGGSRTRRMKRHPWIGAHPDFYVVSTKEAECGLVQAKMSRESFEELPLHYRLQGLAELAVVGGPWVDFAVLTGGDFSVYRVTPEPGEIDDLVADLDDFWHDYIEAHVLPEPTAGSTDALRQRYREAKLDVGKLANAAQANKIVVYHTLGQDMARMKEEREKIGNEIRAAIGDAKWIEGDGFRATWSRWESDEVAWKEVAQAYRRLLDETAALARTQAREDSIEGWERLREIEENLDAIESLYTTKKPGHRLTVTAPKEDKDAR